MFRSFFRSKLSGSSPPSLSSHCSIRSTSPSSSRSTSPRRPRSSLQSSYSRSSAASRSQSPAVRPSPASSPLPSPRQPLYSNSKYPAEAEHNGVQTPKSLDSLSTYSFSSSLAISSSFPLSSSPEHALVFPAGEIQFTTRNEEEEMNRLAKEMNHMVWNGQSPLYELECPLGAGSSGLFWKATCMATEELCAVKVCPKTPFNSEQLISEYHAWKKLEHPNILKLKEVIETDHFVLFASPLWQGAVTLRNMIDQGLVTDESHAAFIFKQVAEALKYCHQQGVAHGDLNLDNVICSPLHHCPLHKKGKDKRGKGMELFYSSAEGACCQRVALLDFGLSTTLDFAVMKKGGEVRFSAPEKLVGFPPYKPVIADLWSLGVLCHMLLTSSLPFVAEKDMQDDEVVMSILRGSVCISEKLSLEAKDLITRLLEGNPMDRLSADSVLAHPFLSQTIPNIPSSSEETPPSIPPQPASSSSSSTSFLPRLKRLLRKK